MKYFAIIFIINIMVGQINAQPYFNKIIHSSSYQPPSAVNLLYQDDNLLLCYGYVSEDADGDREKTSIIVLNNSEFQKIDEVIYDSIDVGYMGLNKLNNNLFLVGNSNKPIAQKFIRIIKLSEDLKELEKVSFEVKYSPAFPIKFLNKDKNIFLISQEEFRIVIYKFDIDAKLIFTKEYLTPDLSRNSSDEILETLDNNLIISSSISFKSKLGRYGHLLKIDTSGNVIWNYVSNEESKSGSQFYAVQLSDGNIVQATQADRWNDPDYNEYFPYPPFLRWVSEDGKFIKDTIYRSMPKLTQTEIAGLKKGRGDYFLGFGQKIDKFDNGWGWIFKMDNNGNFIWSHLYRQPEYRTISKYHYIRDLIEEENGDLTVYGEVFDFDQPKGYLWLFRVNEYGCFDNDKCEEDEEVIFTSKVDEEYQVSRIKIKPNPTSDKINISIPEISHNLLVSIYDMQGQLKFRKKTGKENEVDVSQLTTGTYILNVVCKDHSYYTKFVKY